MNGCNRAIWQHQWPRSPDAHDYADHNQSERQNKIWHYPGNAIKASLGRRGHYGYAVFLYEALQGEIVIVAAIHGSDEFGAHALRVCAAHVIAFEQDLVATTDAHHFVAKVIEAA
jgi:hypothetical protein